MLKRSKDRKVTNLPTPNGKTAKIANSFGLPSGKAYSCPGATSICESVCYAGKLEKMYPSARTLLLHNWNELQGKSIWEMSIMLQSMVQDFVNESVKWDAPLVFRIHWDGDFFSADYAQAWANTVSLFKNVTFWVYTRSFTDKLNVVPIFAGLDNVSLYISIDDENKSFAPAILAEYPWVKAAYMVERFDDFDKTDRKSYNCPENRGSLPLITDKGSACVRCGICPLKRGDVVFSISKR